MFRKAGGISTSDVQIFGKAALWAGPVVGGAQEIALLNAQGHSYGRLGVSLGGLARPISREVDRNADTTAAKWLIGRRRTVARRSIGRRPKPDQAWLNPPVFFFFLCFFFFAVMGRTPCRRCWRAKRLSRSWCAIRWKDRRRPCARIGDGGKPGAPSRLPGLADRLPDDDRCAQPEAIIKRSLSGPWNVGREMRPACEKDARYE